MYVSLGLISNLPAQKIEFPMTSDHIAEDEKARRREAVDFARASVGLEGFKISELHEARAKHYIAGELDLNEFIAGSSDVTPAA